ncbi:MAG: hypothetical protein LBP89_02880 [Helicobacteraceae bacterium]|nr:hypothetical protein [Helicobacteraceae bacterium]
MKTAAALLLIFALCGCSKLAVFEPSKIDDRLSYDERLDSPITLRNADGATLENGQIISRKKIAVERLEKGFSLLAIDGEYAIAADKNGALIFYDKDGKTKRFSFKEPIVSASTDGAIIAAVSKTNACRIIEIDTGKTLFFSQEKPALAVSDRLARALIGKEQAIIPSLDGKLLVVSRASATIVKEIAVGSEEFFGNIIFLGEHGGYAIAATNNRVLSIAPNGTQRSRDLDVRFLSLQKSGLYIFTTDGEILLVSGTLATLSSARLLYARFVAAAEKNGVLWAVEQSGYAARFSDNLQNVKIYELPDAIRAPVYADERGAWHYDKLARWR